HCAIHQFIQRKWANDTAPPAGKPTHLLCDGTYTSRELHRRTKVTGNLVELPMCKMMLRVFRKCSNGRDWLIDLMHQSCGDSSERSKAVCLGKLIPGIAKALGSKFPCRHFVT